MAYYLRLATLLIIRLFQYGAADAALLHDVVGEWQRESGDNYFNGLKIKIDGSYQCNSGRVKDGLVRVLSDSNGERRINLRRTISTANDHLFVVDPDGRRMTGYCPQSGVRWKLVKKSPTSTLVRQLPLLVGEWERKSGDRYFDGLKIMQDGSYQCNSGLVKDGLVRVISDSGSKHKINLKRTISTANDHIFEIDPDGRTMTGYCPQSGVRWKLVKKLSWYHSLVGEWHEQSGDGYFDGMKIDADGAYHCNHGSVTDGLVRVVSSEGDRKINLKRTISDANDHFFVVDPDGLRMTGYCPQSGHRWTLRKSTTSLLALKQSVVGEWYEESGDGYFDGLKIDEDGSYQCNSGRVKDGLVRVLAEGERKINLRRTISDANDHIFEIGPDGSTMTGYCRQSGVQWKLVKKSMLNQKLKSTLAGSWYEKSGDGYFDGLKIEADGSYQCNRGGVTDGRVHVLSEGQINLKRTTDDGFDHYFEVASSHGHVQMEGHCPQNGHRWTLVKLAKADQDMWV